MTPPAHPGDRDEPDVEIGARASARSLHVRSKRRTHVELHGELAERGRPAQNAQTASDSKRQNLPDELEEGATYRDVGIGWRATVRLTPEADSPTDV